MNGTLMEQKNIIENIKKWNELDNQNRLLLEKQKQIREHKNVLTKNICNYLKQTNGSTITIMDDKIKYIERKEYSPLTFTYIQECLHKVLTNEEHIKIIMKVLKENRNVKHIEELKRV